MCRYGYDMAEMTKKMTILFLPKLYEELERVSKEQGRSVGELVRDATEIQYGVGGVAARLRAVEVMSKLETPVVSHVCSRGMPFATRNRPFAS